MHAANAGYLCSDLIATKLKTKDLLSTRSWLSANRIGRHIAIVDRMH